MPDVSRAVGPVPLDVSFFAALEELDQAAVARRGSEEALGEVRLVSNVLCALFDELTAALEPLLGSESLSPRPTVARVRDYVDKGSKRLDDSLRLSAGGWNRDVKLIVDLGPGRAEVFLTSWMAPQDRSRGFARLLHAEGAAIRARLIELSEDLEHRHGVRLHLQHSIRSGSDVPEARGWLENDGDWTVWRANKENQAAVGLWLLDTPNPDWILERASGHVPPASAAGLVLGGLAGRRLAQSGATDLGDAVERATDEAAATWSRLVDGGTLSSVLRDAAVGLAGPLARFRAYMTDRSVWEIPDVEFTASADEIARALLRTAVECHPAAAESGLDVDVDGSRATLGWGTADAPSIQVERPDDGTVRLTFMTDALRGRFPSAYRSKLAASLAGPERDALLDLIGASAGGLWPLCGGAECRKRGRCTVDSELIDHCLVGGRQASLEWVFSSDGGDARWLAAPAHLFTGLLLQALPRPPRLTVPAIHSEPWDVFVSSPGVEIGFAGRRIADALRAERLRTWYMAHHQNPGVDINENTREGIRRSRVVLVVLHDSYWTSSYCVAEFFEAVRCGLPLVPLAATPDGNAETARAQLPGAEDGLRRFGADQSDGLVTRAIEQARSLYGDTIRATVAAGAPDLDATALRQVADGISRLVGRG